MAELSLSLSLYIYKKQKHCGKIMFTKIYGYLKTGKKIYKYGKKYIEFTDTPEGRQAHLEQSKYGATADEIYMPQGFSPSDFDATSEDITEIIPNTEDSTLDNDLLHANVENTDKNPDTFIHHNEHSQKLNTEDNITTEISFEDFQRIHDTFKKFPQLPNTYFTYFNDTQKKNELHAEYNIETNKPPTQPSDTQTSLSNNPNNSESTLYDSPDSFSNDSIVTSESNSDSLADNSLTKMPDTPVGGTSVKNIETGEKVEEILVLSA